MSIIKTEYMLFTVTALGAKFMENTEVRNKYIHLTETLMKIYISRLKNFFYHYDFTYNFSSLKRKEDKCTDTVRTITNAVSMFKIKIGSLSCLILHHICNSFYCITVVFFFQ